MICVETASAFEKRRRISEIMHWYLCNSSIKCMLLYRKTAFMDKRQQCLTDFCNFLKPKQQINLTQHTIVCIIIALLCST